MPAVDETLTIAEPAGMCSSAARVVRTAVIRLSSNDSLPVVVGELSELADVGAAGVVDEAVDAAEALDRRGDEPVGRAALGQVGGDVELARSFVAPSRRHDVRAFAREARRDLEPDAGRRAGDETDLACETQIHGSLR